MVTKEYAVSEIGQTIGPIDLFVCSISYEARCEVVAQQIAQLPKPPFAIIAQNVNHREWHGAHERNLLTLFSDKVHAQTSTDDPLSTADALASAFQAQTVARRILVDITTFTHEALLIVVKLLRDLLPAASVTFIYNKASDYSTAEPTLEKWLSRGVKEIRSVLGYPGDLLPSRKLHLILLSGLEHQRATDLVRAYEPSVLSLGCSEDDGSHSVIHQRYALLRTLYPHAHQFRFDPHDPSKAAASLRTQVGLTRNHNVIVAPMSTKLSTLGVALVAEENDTQVTYATPVLYNHRSYSTPSDRVFVVREFKRDTSTAEAGATGKHQREG